MFDKPRCGDQPVQVRQHDVLVTLLITLLVTSTWLTPAHASPADWITLAAGESMKLNDSSKVPTVALAAAGLEASAVPRNDTTFTFFKTAHGHDYLIIDPCCSAGELKTSLFLFDGVTVKPVDLILGDPRTGFTAQGQADGITVDAGADAVRAFISFADCEKGTLGYYFRFDENDSLKLLSVIDTGCSHLGVRQLYHSTGADAGHWWLH